MPAHGERQRRRRPGHQPVGLEVGAHPRRRDPLRQQHRTPRQPSLHPHNLGAIRLWARIVSDSETDRAQITECAGLPSPAEHHPRRIERGGDVLAVGAGDGLDGRRRRRAPGPRGRRPRPCGPARRRRAGTRRDRRGGAGEQQLAASRDDALDLTLVGQHQPAGPLRQRDPPTRCRLRRRQPGGKRTRTPPVVWQPDRHRRAVGDRHDDRRRRREVDPLDRHGGRRSAGEHVAPREGAGDRQWRVVGDLDQRAPAIVGDRPHALDGVTARDAQPRLGDRRAEHLTLAHGDLARGGVPAIVGGDVPVEHRGAVPRHHRPPLGDVGAPRSAERAGDHRS